MEIFPGIHRSESDLGERFMCQYLLVGGESTILVDTGLAGTPGEVIVPYLEGIGLGVEDLDEVIISHADVDHCGGNSALEEMNPALRFSRGEADRAFVESADRMMAEIYLWSEPYGFGPDEESRTWLRTELGGDSPVDTGLRGGETLRLGPQWRIEVLHLPGHTPGHLGIWDEMNGAAIIIDAALERGIYDRVGNLLQPPRCFDAVAYRRTLRKLRALKPEHLLTAHYQPMRGHEVAGFLDRSLEFSRIGPYPDFYVEIGAGVRSHMGLLGP